MHGRGALSDSRVLAKRGYSGLADDFFDDVAVVEDEHRTAFFVGDARFLIDAQRMINRGGDVGRAEMFRGWIRSLFVAGSDDLADFRAGSGEED